MADPVSPDVGAWAALREGAAASPLDDRRLLTVRGEDRASFLQGMLTNEVRGLAPGQGRHALLLNEQGRVVAELRVFADASEIRLDVSGDRVAALCEGLERFIVADDVEIDVGPEVAVALRGPRAPDVLATLAPPAGPAVRGLGECDHVEVEIGGRAVRVARVRDLGVEGLHLWVGTREVAGEILARCTGAGAVAATAGALEALRIAGGWAREGVDFDSQTLVSEVPSLARGISFRKGCYLGQEVVERVAARGHVNWLVVGLRARRAPADGGGWPVGSVVHEGDAEVGRISSAARLPDEGGLVMVARVRRTAATPGARLSVESADGAVEVEVSGDPGSKA